MPGARPLEGYHCSLNLHGLLGEARKINQVVEITRAKRLADLKSRCLPRGILNEWV
jgi:hypothetical protein